MKIRFIRLGIALLGIAPFLLLSSCNRPPQDHAHYAREAYRNSAQEQSREPEVPAIDQKDQRSSMIDLAEKSDGLEKIPWESVDEWIERIQSVLAMNRDAIEQLKKEISELSERERYKAGEMTALVSASERMRQRLEQQQQTDVATPQVIARGEVIPNLKAPHFSLHLVKKGETLYSIAMQHYGSSAMVSQIALWNQGWVRSADQLMAGLALVLFDESVPYKNEQVVEEYLKSIPMLTEQMQ